MPFNRFKYSDAILRRTDLGQGTRFVYQFLINRSDDTGICWPSVAAIAEGCGMKRRSTQLALRSLEECSLVSVSRHTAGEQRRDRAPNAYTLHDPELGHGAQPAAPRTGRTVVRDGAQPSAPTGRNPVRPNSPLEQTKNRPPSGVGKPVPEPDKQTDLEKAAGTLGLRCIDKLKAAGVTADDLNECANQGMRDGVLVMGAIEWAASRRAIEERNAALDAYRRSEDATRAGHSTLAAENDRRTEAAKAIIEGAGGVDCEAVQAAWESLPRMRNGKPYPIAVCYQDIAEKLVPGVGRD